MKILIEQPGVKYQAELSWFLWNKKYTKLSCLPTLSNPKTNHATLMQLLQKMGILGRIVLEDRINVWCNLFKSLITRWPKHMLLPGPQPFSVGRSKASIQGNWLATCLGPGNVILGIGLNNASTTIIEAGWWTKIYQTPSRAHCRLREGFNIGIKDLLLNTALNTCWFLSFMKFWIHTPSDLIECLDTLIGKNPPHQIVWALASIRDLGQREDITLARKLSSNSRFNTKKHAKENWDDHE